MPSIVSTVIYKILGAVNELHPKLKVPAGVILALTVVSAVLAGLGTVPSLVPYTSLATGILTVVIGWFTPSPA